MTNGADTLKQLESHLWEAANILRGPVDAADFKIYVFPLLFFKRISDVYDEEYAAALAESGGDEEYALFPQNYRFQIPAGCHWTDVRVVTTNVGQALQQSLRGIEKANPETLYGIFGDAAWSNKDRLPDSLLRDLMEHFSRLTLSNQSAKADILGQSYEYLIKKFADLTNKKAGEFYTPRSVVRLMVSILDPRERESIYDPACGTGGMLLEAVHHVRENHGDDRTLWGKLFGQEKNLTTSAIARMNLFLHGIEDFCIVRGDTLSEPKLVQGDRLIQFDVVLANPPYSIKQWNRDAFASDPWGRNLYGTPPQGRADYAFWQHILCSLAPRTGRCAILFPHGVLFQQEEQEMRRKLIDADLIECVLGLGPNLFYNSPMEACVVVCRAGKSKEQKGRILFINAVNEVTRERGQSFLTDDHIERIVGAYREFVDEPRFARVATLEEVRGKDCNLNIPLYVSANGASAPGKANSNNGSISESLSRWLDSASDVRDTLRGVFGDSLPDVAILTDVNPDRLGLLDRVGLERSEWKRLPFGAFADSINQRVEPVDAPEEIYVGLDDLDPGSLRIRRWGKGSDVIGTKLRFRKGDIIFGRRRAYQRKLAVAEMDGICSAHAMVVRAKPDVVLPQFLPFLMTSDNFMNRAVQISVGSLSPTINWTTLKLQEFDLPPLDQQRRVAEILWAMDETVVKASVLRLELGLFADVAIRRALRHGVSKGKATNGMDSWSLKPLGEICELYNGRGFTAAEWAQTGLPIIRIQNLNGSREFNRYAGEPQLDWFVEPGTLLFAWAGVRGVSFGPCIWPGPLGVLNQHIYRIVPNPCINKRWLYETLRVITHDIEMKAHGFKIELVHVRKADITNQVVGVPPSDAQEAIADYAEFLESVHSLAGQQADTMRNVIAQVLNCLF